MLPRGVLHTIVGQDSHCGVAISLAKVHTVGELGGLYTGHRVKQGEIFAFLFGDYKKINQRSEWINLDDRSPWMQGPETPGN